MNETSDGFLLALRTIEVEEEIVHFVDDVIEKNDFELLDILWIFSYSIPSMSGYYNNEEAFKKWLVKVCARNLQKKYNLKPAETKEKVMVFVDFLNSMPDFLSKETFDEDDKRLKEILINKSSKNLVQNIKDKVHDLSDLDRKILSFVLNYIPIRIHDSTKEVETGKQYGISIYEEFEVCSKEVEKIKQWRSTYKDKYGFLFDFHIRTNGETDDIVYFEIDPKDWTYIFNLLFDEELKEQRFKTKPYRRSIRSIQEQYDEYSFWKFGDELVKIGVGYWTFYISPRGNVSIDFIIPNFIYEDIKTYKEHLPIIENFAEKINEIKKKKEWGLEDFEETEAVNEVLESEIETSIISNLEILEEGLELIGNQYSISVGYIDVLCRDKNENLVVIELKRGTGSHKVVGQIQKYMAWVSENLAEGKQVRGIIVVKEYDKELGYAIKGSKFPIEVKIFGQEPPTEENIKYCDRCGKPNKKSAKYCIKCGQEFWM